MFYFFKELNFLHVVVRKTKFLKNVIRRLWLEYMVKHDLNVTKTNIRLQLLYLTFFKFITLGAAILNLRMEC